MVTTILVASILAVFGLLQTLLWMYFFIRHVDDKPFFPRKGKLPVSKEDQLDIVDFDQAPSDELIRAMSGDLYKTRDSDQQDPDHSPIS